MTGRGPRGGRGRSGRHLLLPHPLRRHLLSWARPDGQQLHPHALSPWDISPRPVALSCVLAGRHLEIAENYHYLATSLRNLDAKGARPRSEEHTSELQSLMRISYAVFCLKKKKNIKTSTTQ